MLLQSHKKNVHKGAFNYYVDKYKFYTILDILSTMYLLTQSICTHYFCFQHMGRFVNLKIWNAKSRVQKTRSLLFKKRRGSYPLLFLNNNDLVFCTLLFAPHILDPVFFKVPDPKKISG